MEFDNVKPIIDTAPNEHILIHLNGRLIPVLARQAILGDKFLIKIKAFGGHIINITVSANHLVAVVSKVTFDMFNQE